MKALARALDIEDKVIAIRRDLHEHPEISMQEERTIRIVTDFLTRENITYEIVPHGGVIGTIEGRNPGKTIVLRADLDALPMKEASTNLTKEKTVVSKDDTAAHMCGHDGHTAMLLGAAKILAEHRDLIKGKIILAFEQGEENGKGIYRLLRRLKDIGVDGVWGIHLKSDIPAGKISVDPGPRMAGAFPFNVLIKGRSGHGSRPDLANSPVDCFTHFYTQLQAARLNQLDPFMPVTYSIGSISSGKAANIIPDTLTFSGTARYLHYEQGMEVERTFDQLLKITCELHGCTYEYIDEQKAMNMFVYNEETCAMIAHNAVVKALGNDAIINYPAWMASEPFALYQKYFPGVFAFVGIKNDEKGTGAEHHNAHFDLDEDVLKLGVALTVQYAIDFLNDDEEITYKKEVKSVEDLFEELGLSIYQPDEE